MVACGLKPVDLVELNGTERTRGKGSKMMIRLINSSISPSGWRLAGTRSALSHSEDSRTRLDIRYWAMAWGDGRHGPTGLWC
jgi:hypothetical protein